jgi:hypothetical protein
VSVCVCVCVSMCVGKLCIREKNKEKERKKEILYYNEVHGTERSHLYAIRLQIALSVKVVFD